jgi:hypothetical protein
MREGSVVGFEMSRVRRGMALDRMARRLNMSYKVVVSLVSSQPIQGLLEDQVRMTYRTLRVSPDSLPDNLGRSVHPCFSFSTSPMPDRSFS